MPDDVTITNTSSRTFLRLLVINDPSYEPEEWYTALRKRFMVTIASSIADAVATAPAVDFTCVVAFVGGDIAARAVSDAFEAKTRIVYVRRDDVSADDDVFMLTAGKTWLAPTATSSELIDRITTL
jgi:hypothetical protein